MLDPSACSQVRAICYSLALAVAKACVKRLLGVPYPQFIPKVNHDGSSVTARAAAGLRSVARRVPADKTISTSTAAEAEAESAA
jgi:hypothetical protein